MKITHELRLAQGDRIPWGWGMAYCDMARGEAVCYPLPFNWPARWLRRFYWWLVWPKKDAMEHAFAEGRRTALGDLYEATSRSYEQGVEAGREQAIALARHNTGGSSGESQPAGGSQPATQPAPTPAPSPSESIPDIPNTDIIKSDD